MRRHPSHNRVPSGGVFSLGAPPLLSLLRLIGNVLLPPAVRAHNGATDGHEASRGGGEMLDDYRKTVGEGGALSRGTRRGEGCTLSNLMRVSAGVGVSQRLRRHTHLLLTPRVSLDLLFIFAVVSEWRGCVSVAGWGRRTNAGRRHGCSSLSGFRHCTQHARRSSWRNQDQPRDTSRRLCHVHALGLAVRPYGAKRHVVKNSFRFAVFLGEAKQFHSVPQRARDVHRQTCSVSRRSKVRTRAMHPKRARERPRRQF